MLMRCPQRLPVARNPRRERKLWHDEGRHTPSLGCSTCPERSLCGGLSIGMPVFDCLSLCCDRPESCDKVCRNHPDYAGRVREFGTFALENVPRGRVLTVPPLPPVIPVVFHGSSRDAVLAPPAVALSLYRMFNRREGSSRFPTHEALCAEFGIAPGTPIILTGTDKDPPLERWWSLGQVRRRTIIRALRGAGVVLATTPNYSLFIDVPRWDDLHAMKRIGLAHSEFLEEGLPAALHVNGRTDADFRRWTDYVAARPEVTHVAYEFTTGTGWAGRREKHAQWLAALAKAAGRPLGLLVRGGTEVLPVLRQAFARVTVLETSIFMKTMMRQRAVPVGRGRMRWRSSPTQAGAPLDVLLADNLAAYAGRPGEASPPAAESAAA